MHRDTHELMMYDRPYSNRNVPCCCVLLGHQTPSSTASCSVARRHRRLLLSRTVPDPLLEGSFGSAVGLAAERASGGRAGAPTPMRTCLHIRLAIRDVVVQGSIIFRAVDDLAGTPVSHVVDEAARRFGR